MRTDHKNPSDKGSKTPHPSPDPTRPGPGKPGTKIPVSPDEDNDFSTPAKEIREPENPSEAPVREPDKRNEEQKKDPGPDSPPLPDSPLNDPTRKGDPGIIDPTTPQNPALSSTQKTTDTKGIVFGFILMLLLSFQPTLADVPSVDPVALKKTEEKAAVQQMMNRLEEIKAIDKSELKAAERKSLRKEVREIRQKLAETSGGVYISAGALIIIIILLIILV
jgi:hypothetical protein